MQQYIKEMLLQLGFTPKNYATGIYVKEYTKSGYSIEVSLGESIIYFGGTIRVQNKESQKICKLEDLVVLECVDRLLENGYKPDNISLEKVYPAGHGTSGRLDICVTRDDGSEYLLIECKTYGKEFEKAFNKLKKDGGQLFTYFKFSNKADLIMLYASELSKNEVIYRNEIVKIEDEYRSGDVKDFYEKWNKLTKDNGVFDKWVKPYNFESKALTPKQLKPIRQEDSSFIFNQFLEILRHNVVSDKPNAFNKIFTLFLCKVYDEKNTRLDEELKFQWLEGRDKTTGEDAYVDFLLRLSDLYKGGMLEFLEKEITDFSEDKFNKQYGHLEDSLRKEILKEFNKLRLEKNNEFAIKEVFDNQSFLENSKIVKEVVELLQNYRIRYNKRHQYLSDFFELLLTTGLKQESGQFFTPVPIAQFIIKSLPIDTFVNSKLEKGERDNLLPYVIDYAAGSGHFLTESMHEIQRHLDAKNPDDYIKDTAKKIKTWQEDHFDWANRYVYGVEKDYRLVKVGKVGCYLHGDGLANVIHSDGLARFDHYDYKRKLNRNTKDDYFPKDNQQFDIIISNPPYSVSSFRNTTRDYYTESDFDLYTRLTDNSSEIECLFIERTKQLLKDEGVAGIILPSSILTNSGIYSVAREIILKYFEIIAIAELGSNTFMATDTNTVTLFLRRRNNYESANLEKVLEKFFANYQDVTVNKIEQPIAKYLNHVWQGTLLEDYISLLKCQPNEHITKHELYNDYRKKLKFKTEAEFLNLVLVREKEKILYFLLAYPQKVVLVKTGEKDAEKRFLGYEFSNRRGSEGIHPIKRGASIDECTQLFDPDVFDNPKKASTYIHKAFTGDFSFPVGEDLQNNISRHSLIDMLIFDRVDFEKTISLAVKKKVNFESKWDKIKISEICDIGRGRVISKQEIEVNPGNYPVFSSQTSNNGILGYLSTFDFEGEYVTWTTDGIYAGSVFYRTGKFNCTNVCGTLKSRSSKINMKFLSICLPIYTKYYVVKVANPKLMNNVMASIQVPIPPKNTQKKIVAEIETIEMQEKILNDHIKSFKQNIYLLFDAMPISKVSNVCNISTDKENPQHFPGKEYIYLGLEHIESNTGKIIVNKDIGKNILSAKNIFNSGDILYGKLRPYLNKVACPEFSGICSTDILVLKTKIPKLLKYILLSEGFVKQTSELMNGVSLPRIKPQDFLNINIPIPIASEQQKIVAEIEEIEAKIEKLEQQLNDIPRQKQAVLAKYL